MPLYEYECENGHRFEEPHSVAERNVTCECGAKTIIVIGKVAVHAFTPYYSKTFGRVIKDSKDKSRCMKEKGLEEFSSVSEVRREAKRAEKQEEEKQLNEKPDKEFLKCYAKAQAENPMPR